MRRLISLLFIVVMVGATLLLARTARVSGTSMEPTLRGGEVLLVESVSPRLERLKRGDIVVVELTSEQWLFAELAGGRFVKRVAGLPGETVAIVQGRLVVDGQALDEPYVQGGAPQTQAQAQTLPPVMVPTGAFYLLGDNRSASDDSRTWGPVPHTAILGRAWLVAWPLDRLRRPNA